MKIPGHCAVTGGPCFDIIETWAAGHPFEGQPKVLGRPIDAMRVTAVTMLGAQMQFTMSVDGLAQIEADPTLWVSVWKRSKERMRAERKAHKELGQQSFTDEQLAHADAHNLTHNDDPPLGVLCAERWSDYAQ